MPLALVAMQKFAYPVCERRVRRRVLWVKQLAQYIKLRSSLWAGNPVIACRSEQWRLEIPAVVPAIIPRIGVIQIMPDKFALIFTRNAIRETLVKALAPQRQFFRLRSTIVEGVDAPTKAEHGLAFSPIFFSRRRQKMRIAPDILVVDMIFSGAGLNL